MEKQEILRKVQNIIKKFCSFKPDQITLEANLIRDLGLDSFDFLNLISHAERKFHISFSVEEQESIETVGDVVETIYKKIKP